MTQVVDRTKWTAEKEEIILAVLSKGASVYKAAAAAGIARSTAYNWRDNDDVFRARWDEALECGIDAMEDEALRRAVEGVEKPVFYQGQQCGSFQEYSDNLMIFQLKARRPEKYRETVDHNVSGNITVVVRRFTEIEGDAEDGKLIGEGTT